MSEGTIQFTPESLQEMADVLTQLLKEQIKARLDKFGNTFPAGVDLIASGALINSIRGVVVNGSPEVEIGVPYAPYVEARYGFAGICPAWMPELERRLAPIVDKGAYLAPTR